MTQKEQFKQKLELIQQLYFTFDKPVPFKEELIIYPFLLGEYYEFFSAVNLLTMNKNKTKEGIKKTHLTYILSKCKEEGETSGQFINLLGKIFHIDPTIMICPNCEEFEPIPMSVLFEKIKKIQEAQKAMEAEQFGIRQVELFEVYQGIFNEYKSILICPTCGAEVRPNISLEERKLYVGRTEITSQEYAELRDIVCYQNMVDFSNEELGRHMDKEYEEIKKLKSSKSTPPSLEKKMACVISEIGGSFQTLQETWTIRKFELFFKIMCEKLEYTIAHQGEMSGMVSFKVPLKHWIFEGNEPYSKSSEFGNANDLQEKLAPIGMNFEVPELDTDFWSRK